MGWGSEDSLDGTLSLEAPPWAGPRGPGPGVSCYFLCVATLSCWLCERGDVVAQRGEKSRPGHGLKTNKGPPSRWARPCCAKPAGGRGLERG